MIHIQRHINQTVHKTRIEHLSGKTHFNTLNCQIITDEFDFYFKPDA